MPVLEDCREIDFEKTLANSGRVLRYLKTIGDKFVGWNKTKI